jgi:hypothetical protein
LPGRPAGGSTWTANAKRRHVVMTAATAHPRLPPSQWRYKTLTETGVSH